MPTDEGSSDNDNYEEDPHAYVDLLGTSSASASSSVAPALAIEEFPPSVRPYLSWTGMARKVRLCSGPSWPRNHRIEFNLAPPSIMLQGVAARVQYLSDIVRSTLASHPEWSWKVGISYTPMTRFYFYDYEHCELMILAIVSEQPQVPARCETKCIDYWKLQPNSRMLNIRPGGENFAMGWSPFFCYLTFGTRAQFLAWKRGRNI